MIFETHAHYDDDRFKDDRDETIKRVHEKGVAPIINVGASIGSTMTTIELAKKYDFIYAAVGVHPSDVADFHGVLCCITRVYDNRQRCFCCKLKLTLKPVALVFLHLWLLIPVIVQSDFPDCNSPFPCSLFPKPCKGFLV